MQLSVLQLKNESKKDSMKLAGDHCKLDPVKNSVKSGGHLKSKIMAGISLFVTQIFS